MSDNNPYEPPKADLRPEPDQGAATRILTLLAEPRAFPLSAGMRFWSASWGMVRQHLGTWVVITVVLFALQLVLGLVISQAFAWEAGYLLVALVATVFSTVLTGGILIGAHAVAVGQALQIDHLFAGFGQCFKPLALLGAVSFGISQLVEYLVKAIGLDMEGLANGAVLPTELLSGLAFEQLALIVMLYLLVMMASWFTVPLVVLNNVPIRRAFALSFKGCLRNPLPLIVYALVLGGLLILGALPLMLGLLVVIPWWFASLYVSYRQIFLK